MSDRNTRTDALVGWCVLLFILLALFGFAMAFMAIWTTVTEGFLPAGLTYLSGALLCFTMIILLTVFALYAILENDK